MATSNIPYVQDADQWVAYYLDMAKKGVLDPRLRYSTGHGSMLYPVEKKNVVFGENEEPEKKEDNVNITLVTPIQQTVEQIKEEVKEYPSTSTVSLDIKVPKQRKTVIQKRTGKQGTSLVKGFDQLSKSKHIK